MVEQFIKKHALIQKGATVIVGVSGGPDSMALLHFLHQRRYLWHIKIIACSIDHQLRGEEAKADLLYVRHYCDQQAIEFEGRSVDVPHIQKEEGLSVEVAARKGRYQVFEEVMETWRADVLALAHHGDDQIETMLMRQVRGSFGTAKAGIPVKRDFACGQIIRPFLTVTKEQLLDYCKRAGIDPRIDPSNSSEAFTRNRFRKYVLPFLKKENPLVHLRFQEDSEKIRDDALYLDELAKERFQSVLVEYDNDRVSISIRRLIDTPIPLQRRIIHLILNYLYNHANIDADHQSIHIEDLLYWLRETKASGEKHLPKGLLVKRSYDLCRFSFDKGMIVQQFNQRVPLLIPGMTPTDIGNILAEIIHTYPSRALKPNEYICDLHQLKGSIYYRLRRPGDRFQPLGMNGTKKVKDLFIDHKINHMDRERWPLIVDENDAILWIPYLRRADIYKTTSETTCFLKLTIEASAFGRTYS
ncbi:tRNA lysidine(34) synthetase TilS [Pullulanibacillus camelliae]|nr:tRNA lysidine(34) synthetase TilS [Pullulanibacillus camelliae]